MTKNPPITIRQTSNGGYIVTFCVSSETVCLDAEYAFSDMCSLKNFLAEHFED